MPVCPAQDRRAPKPECRAKPLRPGSVAENQLVQKHIPLVKSIVGRLAMTLPAHVEVDDLYSVGLVGLLNAIRNFNPNSGSSLETYARVRIRGAVFDELRRMDWVPRSIHSKAKKVQAKMQELEQRNGKVPTEVEMARALKLSLGDYRACLEEIRPATYICLDAAPSGDPNDHGNQYESFADRNQESPFEGTRRHEVSEIIAERLKDLPEMQRKVLSLYYFEDLRLREIAESFGLTESRICQIHAQAIIAIKAHLEKYDLAAA